MSNLLARPWSQSVLRKVAQGKRSAAGGAALLILFVCSAILGCGNQGQEGTVTTAPEPTNTVQAQATQAAIPTADTSVPAAPSSTASPSPATYTVQPGDSLLGICLSEVPEMDADTCVSQVVALNGLSGPDRIAIDQVLVMPGVNSQNQPAVSTTPVPTGTTPQTPATTVAAATPLAQSTAPTASTLAIVSLNSPVGVNEMVTLVAQTMPGALCTVAYETPSLTSSNADGLGSKTADASGAVSWTWQIGPRTNPGTGTVTVSCGEESVSRAIVITS